MCGLIAEGHSLRDIEAMKGLPSKLGIMKWLLEGEAYKAAGKLDNSNAQFVDQFALAREVQATCWLMKSSASPTIHNSIRRPPEVHAQSSTGDREAIRDGPEWLGMSATLVCLQFPRDERLRLDGVGTMTMSQETFPWLPSALACCWRESSSKPRTMLA
ncbi:hypothetical protein [Bradyrhizobium sp. NC92]|uniref:hypothetical protein n=1 Tax=Bradyrhizobium sp. (strain NC92) TaxID=55395 RepID=UPI0021A99345|nr:hypothetical protein [Bradyrhizobium sp. NC92]UWU66104.1 hypothetical protein N2602_22910 [Bradyrhizobium sp. NC92]